MNDHSNCNQLDLMVDLDVNKNSKIEKEKVFQLQQKRLQEMSLSKLSKNSNRCGSQSTDSIDNMINKILENSKNMKLEFNSNSPKLKSTNKSTYLKNSSSPTAFTNSFQSFVKNDENSKRSNLEPLTESQTNYNKKPADDDHELTLNYPSWCPSHPCFITNSIFLPPIYLQVWNLVKLNNESTLCDTSRLYPILLSSQLPTNLLANIWSQVNKTVPGQLTFLELMLTLALIGLHQCYPNSIFQLKNLLKITHAPTPFFKLPSHNFSTLDESDAKLNKVESTFIKKNLNYSSQEPNVSDSNDEDFAEFQSVPPINNNIQDLDNWGSFSSSPKFFKVEKNLEVIEKNYSEDPEETQTYSLSKNSSIFFQSSIEDENKKTFLVEQENLTKILDSLLLTHTTDEISSTTEKNDHEASKNIINQNCNVDRYQALKDFFKETYEKSDDEFGEFKSHSKPCELYSLDSNHNNLDESNEKIKMWIQVLKCAKQLLHKVFNVLIVNHGEDRVIEALSTEKGSQYILDLAEVYYVSQRIYNYYLHHSKPYALIAELMDDINMTWKSLKKLFAKVPTKINLEDIKKDSNPDSNLDDICSICFSSSNGILFSGNRYHSSCANLWLNCIESTLPVFNKTNQHIQMIR